MAERRLVCECCHFARRCGTQVASLHMLSVCMKGQDSEEKSVDFLQKLVHLKQSETHFRVYKGLP